MAAARWLLSPLARDELQAALEYIAEESGSPNIADKVAEDFAAALDQLAATPHMGWKRPHLTGPGIRWWRVHRYLVLYDPEAKPLRVIRILHGSRNLDALFHGTP